MFLSNFCESSVESWKTSARLMDTFDMKVVCSVRDKVGVDLALQKLIQLAKVQDQQWLKEVFG
jgi:hypothetical protein